MPKFPVNVCAMIRRKTNDAVKLKGNVNHSVCRWCYPKIKLDDLCAAGKAMGLVAIDLLNPPEFATVQRHGLTCSMVSFPTMDGLGGIAKAWNRVEHHDRLVPAYTQRLQETADAGYARLICFSGNRAGLDDEQGLENCVVGLQRILPLAEKLKVTLCMELLNSKRDHSGYMCDHTAWGVRVMEEVNSPRIKLLYDIYHMQIMEGDLIASIGRYHQWIGHFHTGGVPGRHELDGTQEVRWDGVMRGILATGFNGYVAHEFIPTKDPLVSLREAVDLCDV